MELGVPCFKIPDNRYPQFPARMADGRLLTDYRSPCIIDSILQKNNSITSSEEYRQFLINNASKIVEANNQVFLHLNGLSRC